MNERDKSTDEQQRHCDIDPVEPDATPETEQEEPSAPLNTGAASAESVPTAEPDGTVAQPEHEAHLPSGTAENESSTACAPESAEGVAPSTPSVPADGNAEDRAPEQAPESEPTGQAPAVGADEGQPGAESECQVRRVLLQAGTDEESLKALALCREKVTQLHLRMHPLAARWESDRHVVIFFRADDKVDFRKLVRELSRLLRARIELRQVGPREQGKLCGLVGKCGYRLCCQTFLGQFAQSTIKMAKTQELALNPMKISGVCGRLLCCLNYEQEMYLEAKSRMPRVNRMVQTEFGQGRVVAVNVLKETVTVQLETMTKELRPDQVQLSEGQS